MTAFRVLFLYAPAAPCRDLPVRLSAPEWLVAVAATPEQVRHALKTLRPHLLLMDLAASEAGDLLADAVAAGVAVVAAATDPEAERLAASLVEKDAVAAYVPDLGDLDSAEDLVPALDAPPPVPSRPLSPDPDRYVLLEKRGEGSTGEVWRAHDRLLDMDVAIKILRSDLSADSESVAAMKAEARIAMELSHSNLVRLYNLLQAGGRTYLVMEYIEGESVELLIRRHGALDPELVAGVVASCAAGLDYAHRHHVLHRDLKPSNLLLTADDKLRIIDFGLAALVGPATSGADELAGTPPYMSPEQLRGDPLTPASDQYSLGIVAYQMLTGRLPEESAPFDPAHPERYVRGPLAGVPPAIRLVLERATAPRPEDRYRSVGAFSSAFVEAIAASVPASRQSPSPVP